MADDVNETVIDLASRKPIDQAAWFARLQRNQNGIIATVANALVIFGNDPMLKGLLAYNAFRSEHLMMRPPPASDEGVAALTGNFPEPWDRQHVAMVLAYFQRVWSSRFTRGTIEDAMVAEASQRHFHPVTAWLSTLAWDGKPRVDRWLTAAFDCVNNRYHRAVGAKTLIAAVRRVRSPGCKFDHMLVLEGAQGIGKSRSLRALFRDTWFSDTVPPDLTNKDAAMALLGVWCMEFAEIEHLIRHEVEVIKAFLSRSTDHYRPPYSRSFIDRPRQGILIGTTNSDDYLRDSTGNRRIWPVKCNAADPSWIELNRDQIWAEAAVREAAGETIWLDDDEVQVEATEAQARRLDEEVWHVAIEQWLLGRDETRTGEVLSDALSMPKAMQGKKDQMRVAAILRRLGWTKHFGRRDGTGGKIWARPGTPPRPPDEDEGQNELNLA